MQLPFFAKITSLHLVSECVKSVIVFFHGTTLISNTHKTKNRHKCGYFNQVD